MEERFQKILTLVDFSDVSLHAAEEAALIASKFDAELHLMHISSHQRSNNLITEGMPFFEAPEKEEEQYYLKIDRLEMIKQNLNRHYGLAITCFEDRGNFIDAIRHHVKDFSIDLIVIGAKKRNWVKEIFIESKARSVIKLVGCEVLCVHPESPKNTLKKIVLPVGKSISRKKIAIAYELAKKFAANIHLIALNKQEKPFDGKSTEILIASYRYLRDITNMPIECATIFGKNLADATMRYAKVIEADLILIDEGAESDLKMSLWKADIVNHSSVPILSVQSITQASKYKYRA